MLSKTLPTFFSHFSPSLMSLVIFTANLGEVDMKEYLQHLPSPYEAAAKIHPFYAMASPDIGMRLR